MDVGNIGMFEKLSMVLTRFFGCCFYQGAEEDEEGDTKSLSKKCFKLEYNEEASRE